MKAVKRSKHKEGSRGAAWPVVTGIGAGLAAMLLLAAVTGKLIVSDVLGRDMTGWLSGIIWAAASAIGSGLAAGTAGERKAIAGLLTTAVMGLLTAAIHAMTITDPFSNVVLPAVGIVAGGVVGTLIGAGKGSRNRSGGRKMHYSRAK